MKFAKFFFIIVIITMDGTNRFRLLSREDNLIINVVKNIINGGSINCKLVHNVGNLKGCGFLQSPKYSFLYLMVYLYLCTCLSMSI